MFPIEIEAILFIPNLTTHSKYTLKWNLGFIKLQGNGDGGSNLGTLIVCLLI